jgi:multidrug efflux system membrane fusion protein
VKRVEGFQRSARALAAVAILAAGLAGCRRAEKQAASAAPVTVAAAATGPAVEWVELFGRVVPPPDRDATIAPQVAGVLLAVGVREGDPVKKNDVVARVDSAPLVDALASAAAAARRASADAAFRRRTAERTRGLFDKGVASGQEAEADEAAAVGADASLSETTSALAVAKRRLAWAELRAPFDGVVLKVLRRAGDTVDGSPATPVVEIASPTPVQVAADATSGALRSIAPGQRAEVSIRGEVASQGEAATRGEAATALPARVLRVSRSVDAATGAGEVRLDFADAAVPLVLGTSVSIRVAVREKSDALTVPAAAIRRGPDGAAQVVVVEGTTARVRAVELGIAGRERAEILSGLKAGEQVVVDDPVGLVDGMAVSVRP